MNLKGLQFADVAEIQVAVNDDLKKIQNGEFSTAFQILYDCAEACIYANGVYFEQIGMSLSHVSYSCVFLICLRLLKVKSFLNRLDSTV